MTPRKDQSIEQWETVLFRRIAPANCQFSRPNTTCAPTNPVDNKVNAVH